MRFSKKFLSGVQMGESCLGTMQLQVSVGQPEVGFRVVRLQLESDLKILGRFCAFVKVIQDEPAAFISSRHLRIAFQSAGKIGQRLVQLAIVDMDVALDQRKIFVVSENW